MVTKERATRLGDIHAQMVVDAVARSDGLFVAAVLSDSDLNSLRGLVAEQVVQALKKAEAVREPCVNCGSVCASNNDGECIECGDAYEYTCDNCGERCDSRDDDGYGECCHVDEDEEPEND